MSINGSVALPPHRRRDIEMPLALIALGIVAVITAINGTFKDLAVAITTDVTQRDSQGRPQFLMWIAAVLIVGMIGYIPGLERISRWFLALVIIGLVIANGGVFDQLTSALNTGPQADTGGQPLSANSGNAPSISQASLIANTAGMTAAQFAAAIPTSAANAASGSIPKVNTNPTTGLGIGGV